MPEFSVVRLCMSSGPVGVLSSSTGAALIAGVVMSMRRFCVAKAGDVLCENVPLRETGEMGPESAVVGVEANGVVAAMVAMYGVWWAVGARFKGRSRVKSILAQPDRCR
jgi:hypothetical protein